MSRSTSSREADAPRLRRRKLHGHRVAFRQEGSGPVVVLVHGITSSSAAWNRVLPYLARRFTVLAPDLPGHGGSDKPRGDYSLGAFASTLRDLLATLGHERATFVGHSLGGGIAMQLSYQHPELCERLILVDSGGLGREVSPLLRAATLPGSEFVLPLLAATRLLGAGELAAGLLSRVGLRPATDMREMARGQASLSSADARSAFVHTLRAVVDAGGQRIAASDRLYLARHVPLMLVWGERDTIIPVSHAHAAHRQVPGSRLELFRHSGHFPQIDEPQRFIDVLVDFIESTEPASIDAAAWRALLAGTGSREVRVRDRRARANAA
ncbi:MAG TPA: alpha/beta fold hydrolase [Solirubrobacteraceae bacterium]|nr:alpha/beta fold hydrolase [Solirubrobacteraceae bacterium]